MPQGGHPPHHSITSSARASSVVGHGEAEHPRGLWVDDQLELRRLHDRQVGRLGALEDAAGVDADLAIRIRQARFRSSSARRLRQNRATYMSRGCGGAPPGWLSWTRRLSEERAAADEECVGPLARESCEGCIDLAAGAGVEKPAFAVPWREPPLPRSRNVTSAVQGWSGLTSTATRAAPGTSSCRSSSRFAVNSAARKLIPVTLPPGRARAGDKTKLDRVVADVEERSGSSWLPLLAANGAASASGRDDEANPSANQFGRHRRQSICPIVGPAVFDRQVFALDIADVFETLTKSPHRFRQGFGRGGI